MEGTTSLETAKLIMGDNFIGPTELNIVSDELNIYVPSNIPSIPYAEDLLKKKSEDYILILGASEMKNKNPLTIKYLRETFGTDPQFSEPCFYNQDWYLKEDFINIQLKTGWYLIRKNIYDFSRAQDPELLKNNYNYPSAVLSAFVFFACWFVKKESLWKNDFIWCNDKDFNEDRIYVGRYYDKTGLSKNGFSIHRQLRIRNNYGVADIDI